ncbi:MAG: GAP family protein [Candidatus ainarchaeum sp.]|nr:GAP family protein [Candidatus ainarchaeum sp.]
MKKKFYFLNLIIFIILLQSFTFSFNLADPTGYYIISGVNESTINELTYYKNTSELNDFSIIYLIFLALIDSISPIEIIALIILISTVLAKYPQDTNRALKCGLLFSFGVFLAYAFFGIVFLIGLKFFSQLTNFSNANLFIFLGIITTIIGVLTIKNSLKYNNNEMTIDFPLKYKLIIDKLILGTVKPKGALITGIALGLFLSLGTSAPYFIALGLLSTLNTFDSFFFLLIYLIVFIMPLISITFLAQQKILRLNNFSEWKKNNLKKINLITGILMIALGIFLFIITI